VTRELNLLSSWQLEDLLEAASNRQENVLTLLGATSLSASNIAIASAGNALSDGASPDTNTEESLTDVDDNAHDLAIVLVLKGLANGAHHNLEPKTVDVDIALVLVLVRPLATVLVLGVLPLGADTLLEEMVVGLERKLGYRGDVVLVMLESLSRRAMFSTYIDTPKLFNRVEGDNLFKEIVPVVTLSLILVFGYRHTSTVFCTFPLGGLVNQRVHLFWRGCLTLKLSLS
jgi:hypothetical protein